MAEPQASVASVSSGHSLATRGPALRPGAVLGTGAARRECLWLSEVGWHRPSMSLQPQRGETPQTRPGRPRTSTGHMCQSLCFSQLSSSKTRNGPAPFCGDDSSLSKGELWVKSCPSSHCPSATSATAQTRQRGSCPRICEEVGRCLQKPSTRAVE